MAAFPKDFTMFTSVWIIKFGHNCIRTIILKIDSALSYCFSSQKWNMIPQKLFQIFLQLYLDLLFFSGILVQVRLLSPPQSRNAFVLWELLSCRRARANQVIQQIKYSCWEVSFGWHTRCHQFFQRGKKGGDRCWHHPWSCMGRLFLQYCSYTFRVENTHYILPKPSDRATAVSVVITNTW